MDTPHFGLGNFFICGEHEVFNHRILAALALSVLAEYQFNCWEHQVKGQNIYQRECQIKCHIRCHVECHVVECEIKAQIECQNVY